MWFQSTLALLIITTTPVFPSVEFDVKRGELVAVVGQVGAGKSSLVQALLGEMEKLRGTVALRVSVYIYY